MKKILCLILVCGLCALFLGACDCPTDSDGAEKIASNAVPEVTAVPEEGEHGEEDQSLALAAMPTLEPAEPLSSGGDEDASIGAEDGYFDIDALLNRRDAEADDTDPGLLAIGGSDTVANENADPDSQTAVASPAGSGIDTSTWQFSALTDTSLGFTFNYPSHWINVPGVYTVCFKEPVEDGEFPARVAITVKNLVHTPDEQAMTEQMTSYMRIIHKQYDNATFESGTPNMQDTFLGKQALSNTYLAYWGNTEVKGFVIGASAGRTVCVFHFCASYDDYLAMENTMRYMLRSVQVVSNE